jgi:hypothetical protein
MAEAQATTRKWFVDLGSEEARLRCAYHRTGREISQFTVQLEILVRDAWLPIVRYDNAHGFCHRDTLHPDGTQDKTALFFGDTNETFTFAIEDLRTNWENHRDRFVGEMKP